MSKTWIWITACCCVTAVAAVAWAQANRKPGLYEVTTQMSMGGAAAQMPQMPAHTSQVCVTQAMIDKYGGPTSNPQTGNCQMTNVQLTAAGMTATMSCSGRMNMTGTVQTTFVDADTTKTSVHMTATMGTGGQTMDMTMQSTATFKGADCGSVKPLAMPASQ